MNGLLLLRNQDAALDEVEFTRSRIRNKNETNMKIWIRHVLLCQAQVLLIDYIYRQYLTFHGPPLVGWCLRKLKLANVHLQGNNFLDFARCPVLVDLEITHCGLVIDKILSQSLKHLTIENSLLSWHRIQISVPTLISLQLKDNGGMSPLFEDMPSLETGIFSFGAIDYCRKDALSESCYLCANWCRHGDQIRSSHILGGLSNATNLELIIYSGKLIFSRWCPTFIKLKKLLLHVLAKVVDLQWMVCILEHSPVLEKLTLQVPKLSGARKLKGSYNGMEQLTTISEHLNVVEIKCGEVDARVFKILKLLSRFVKHININRTDEPLACFIFS